MGAHLSALATALQTPQSDKDNKHKSTRKAQEALDKTIIFEEECKEWLRKASADLQQKVQAAAATAAAHQRQLRSSLEAQPPSSLQPAAINLTAILETTEPDDLGKLVCFEDGDLFSFGDLELEQEEIEQWNRHKSELAAEVGKLIVAAAGPSAQGLAQRKQAFAEYRARMAHKRRRTAAGGMAAGGDPAQQREADGGPGGHPDGDGAAAARAPAAAPGPGAPPAPAAASTAGDPSGAAPEPAPPEASPEDLAKTLAEARARREASRAAATAADGKQGL
ncbi:unnamed protein product [Prorocentrum cordatum]|uniref:Uncharacterized protein n=1 Tax=Prorocentrum cordatum TaxID=2364126 RepID=A0ABN9SQ29_9DINO|nr:unnamed protein product [Polarella glacialis]